MVSRRSRRLDFFTDGPAMPPPAEGFVSLLRHRLRGAEAERVSVAVERLVRAWEEADAERLLLLGCVEEPDNVKVLLRIDAESSLERVGPRLADAMGCTVAARDLGDGVVAITLTDLDAGRVSFLPVTARREASGLITPSICLNGSDRSHPRDIRVRIDRTAS